MITEEHAASKRPVSAMLAGPYGHPFHPILVTVPIGAWVASLVFDVASRFADDPGFLTQGSQWLIALGVVGAVAAASIGFLDLFVIPPRTPAYATALVHMSLNLGITAAYVVAFFWRHSSDGDGHRVAITQLVLSIICLGALAVSGALGGRLAYSFGVRVADESTQSEGFVPRHRATAPSR
jgi:uncharacterized membrane protein